MIETVTVTPDGGINSDGDPDTDGATVTLIPLEVAPGNLLLKYGTGGDLTDVQFTIYLPLQVNISGSWTDTETLVRTGDRIEVRGRDCIAFVQVWKSQRGNRGGVVILAHAKTGKAA